MDVVLKTHPVSGKVRPQDKDFDERRKVVRVTPKNDELRKFLKHPTNRVGFLAEGSAEWPNDAFTKRRIKDGDVTVVEEQQAPADQKAIESKSGGKAPKTKEPPEAPKSET